MAITEEMIMKVTRKILADCLAIDIARIKQIASKQLFIVEETSGVYSHSLYSYKTKVGVCSGNVWQLTTEKYSPTTSKQLTQFANAMSRKGYGVIRTYSVGE
jgi:hypothetical protein